MRRIVVLLLIFLVPCPMFAGELFVSSNPLNADVWLNGEYAGKTPLRKSGLKDAIDIAVRKEGFGRVEEKVEADGSRTTLLFYELQPLTIDLVLNQDEKEVFLNDVFAGNAPLVVRNIPDGIYHIGSGDRAITLSNAEYTRARKTTIYETAFSVGLTALSFTGAFNDQPVKGTLRVSSVIFGGLLGYNLLKLLKLQTAIRDEKRSMRGVEVLAYRGEEDRDMFSKGMEFVGTESWDEALAKFNLLINVYPDSSFVPLSIYEMGYIYYQLGRYEEASKYTARFVFDYPAYEFFTLGVFQLLRADMNTGDYGGAAGHYKMVRPLYLNEANVEEYIEFYKIMTELYTHTGEKAFLSEDLFAELQVFLDKNEESLSYPDILLLKGKLLYLYLDEDRGLKLLGDMKEDFPYRKDIISEVEGVLDAR